MSSQSKKTKKSPQSIGKKLLEIDSDLVNTDPVPSDSLFVAHPLPEKFVREDAKASPAPKPILKLEISRITETDRISANYLHNTTTKQEAYIRRAQMASDYARAQYEEMITALITQMIDSPETLEFESVDFSELPEDVFAAMCHIVAGNGWKAVLEEKVFRFMLDPVSPIAVLDKKQSPLLR